MLVPSKAIVAAVSPANGHRWLFEGRMVQAFDRLAEKISREAVLEFTYAAHDMLPLARGADIADEDDAANPQFRWNEKLRTTRIPRYRNHILSEPSGAGWHGSKP
ncbi:MAG: hypothetical protein OXI01_14210 [Albidovulum sp.]|nr:hypothetical protein [Albidovulum sp.]